MVPFETLAAARVFQGKAWPYPHVQTHGPISVSDHARSRRFALGERYKGTRDNVSCPELRCPIGRRQAQIFIVEAVDLFASRIPEVAKSQEQSGQLSDELNLLLHVSV